MTAQWPALSRCSVNSGSSPAPPRKSFDWGWTLGSRKMRSHLRETRARILLENFRMFHSHMTPFSHVRFSTLFFLFSVSSCASVYFLLFFCLSLIPPHPTFLMDSFSLFNGLYHPSFPLLPFSSYRFIAPSPPIRISLPLSSLILSRVG